ncbi:hypothetical protein BLD48_04545 [Exiguobacterium sp. KRL4]|uniref:hypothetical protein n=1 Tax=Exiguobacterium sp. KRL4 TaxID=1914536 RepID=UPI0008F89D9E|nr:hypothetical protein [Exiguobacterium sp. KRL4]OIN67486.1 hypothetical protein BLD48_04545 [Exiguobacterium sp. KRL4]
MTVRSGHPQRRGRSLFFMCVVLILGCLAGRLYWVSPYVASYDIANFTLAVGQYDLANLQPHFPGYPFFILLATGLARLGLDPVRALGVVSTLGFASGLVPLYLLFKRHPFDTVRLLAAFTVVSTASLVVLSATGMSDGLALGVLCWFVWSVERARQDHFRLLPYILFGLLMATRLSYAPFGIVLLFLLWQVRRDTWQVVSEIAVLLLAQLAWLLPVAFSVGGPASFAQLSLSFVTGHFSDWGGTAQTDEATLLERLGLTLKQIVWHGLGFATWIGLGSGLFLFCQRFRSFPLWWSVTGTGYFLWGWFAQNIDKPRHVLPLVLLLVVLLVRRLSVRWLVPFLCIQLVIGSIALYQQATTKTATIQLAEAITALPASATIFTDEEERQFLMTRPDATIVPIGSVSKWRAEPKSQEVYLTGRLLERLRATDVPIEVTEVFSFTSDPRFEPEDAEARLYRMILR